MSAEYKYFISYLYEDGGGNVDITLAEPIQSIDDIRGVEKAISDEFNLGDSVTIQNFIQLNH
ncbi:hypothetical protein [Lentibacillus amyloliquefaciens]|uniref:Uncharacterized protein n=1 Tax=Lentibacillus amyloliquefaciens TaxID=1472767 RepID=A0A0U4F229_9BACI|nr:hypothetical protein [Lentibacillus amyloliquefaciens]ALX47638.1 hypothetical protein AOX59_02890 [Lentibacillus amyloliquefaciens]